MEESFEELERYIKRQLYGDDTQQGLFRGFVSAADWDTVVRIKGIIFAYERILEQMQEITRRMNEPLRRHDEPPPMPRMN